MGRSVRLRANVHRTKYLKINANQMLVLDALLEHGGNTKKYLDRQRNLRFSEHYGLIDFNDTGLDRIIISANTIREDQDDPDILLPENMHDAVDFEYVFHTHPPTPAPGGRAKEGVLLELPSVSDIFHFIDHYNDGCTQGSLVIASEGVYILRASGKAARRKRIAYDLAKEEQLMAEVDLAVTSIHEQSIQRYGSKTPSPSRFYDTIAQDLTYARLYNEVLKQYLGGQVKLKFHPRVLDHSASPPRWVLPELQLRVDPKRPMRSHAH